MVAQWTKERKRHELEIVESVIRFDFKMTCVEFHEYEYIMGKPEVKKYQNDF